jgi:hypothetical protein
MAAARLTISKLAFERTASIVESSTFGVDPMQGHCQRRGCQTHGILYRVKCDIFGADAARAAKAGERWYCWPCLDEMMTVVERDTVNEMLMEAAAFPDDRSRRRAVRIAQRA